MLRPPAKARIPKRTPGWRRCNVASCCYLLLCFLCFQAGVLGCARSKYRQAADREAYCLIDSRQTQPLWELPDRAVESEHRRCATEHEHEKSSQKTETNLVFAQTFTPNYSCPLLSRNGKIAAEAYNGGMRTLKGLAMRSSVYEGSSPYRACTPPLESGDVLDAGEYWRRYRAAPRNLKAERINGKVYIMSPLRAVHHGNPHLLLAQWIANYAMHHSDLVGSDNATIRLNSDNNPQPDLCLLRVPGNTQFDEEGYIVGPPELIIEIAGSSASYDLGEKRNVYEAAGIGEYLVFESIEGEIKWWRSANGHFIAIEPEDGVYKSVLFPGLWLDGEALRTANAAGITATLEAGMRSV